MSDENKNTAKTTDPIWDSRNSDEPKASPVQPCHLAAAEEIGRMTYLHGFGSGKLHDVAAIIAKHCPDNRKEIHELRHR